MTAAAPAHGRAVDSSKLHEPGWSLVVAYALLLLSALHTLAMPRRMPAPSRPPASAHHTPQHLAASQALFAPMAALVQPHGFELQEHFVTTQDGFILRLFRIPGRTGMAAAAAGAHANATCSKPVVFLQHALMDSSAGWLLLGPHSSLALLLAHRGYDVWLGNARGNRFSRNHTRLAPQDRRFWAWSWQQQAEFDLPASIGYALDTTQRQRLVCIGYSQGTMTALAALSNPHGRVASAVSLAILLAPVGITASMRSTPFVVAARLGADRYAMQQGWGEWGSHQPYWSRVCSRVPRLCWALLSTLCGANPEGGIGLALVRAVFELSIPSGTSVQNMAHMAQGIRRSNTTHLHAFDHGTHCSSQQRSGTHLPTCNQQAYGQEHPLAYDPAAITTPLALFSGGQDTLATLADVQLLKRRLAPGVLQLHQHLPSYAHLDFELRADAHRVLYPAVVRLVRQFSQRGAAAQ